VSIKLSGLGFIRRDWDQALVALLAQVVDLFGTQRCMIASDTPTDKLFAPLALSGHLSQLSGAFSEDEQRDLWGRNPTGSSGHNLRLNP
jgi:predicted TIM-barrel fold metal-dependent hydrolase